MRIRIVADANFTGRKHMLKPLRDSSRENHASTARRPSPIFRRARTIFTLLPWIASAVAVVAATTAADAADMGATHKHEFTSSGSSTASIAPLVDKVRMATARYLDINVALNEGWVQATPCVSGPTSGAMGVHFVLPQRVGDGALNASEPEALIYEPLPNGAMRLVGVEFIVIASDWADKHPEGGTPAVDGHLTNLVSEPNRYGLHSFYELHVWAWEHNPNGSFSDWNTRVSCDNQPTPQS
jgi:hypothetical protein